MVFVVIILLNNVQLMFV